MEEQKKQEWRKSKTKHEYRDKPYTNTVWGNLRRRSEKVLLRGLEQQLEVKDMDKSLLACL